MDPSINVLGGPLRACSHQPKTGWFRDGCCNTDDSDKGFHTVCAFVTTEFLLFLKQRGNDLTAPVPGMKFPGLKEGDQWCVNAAYWHLAFKNGYACPVSLEATHQRALEVVPLEALLMHAIAEKV